MGKNGAHREAAKSVQQVSEAMRAAPQVPDRFYSEVLFLLHKITKLLQPQKGRPNEFIKNPHALDIDHKKGRGAVSESKSAERTHSSAPSGSARPARPDPSTLHISHAGQSPERGVNKNKAAAKTINSNSSADAKKGVNFEFVTKDIAEAQNGIIVIMTDANLLQKMPGAQNLARKFGAPQKSTGVEPEIGSIVLQKTGNKEIWHLVSKQNMDDKKEVSSKQFYTNHVNALKALREKMIERNVKRVAITRLGAGYLGVQWRITASKLRQIFQNDDVKFVVHSLPKKVSDPEMRSAAGRIQGESETSQVAQGVAGGCLLQLPGKSPDSPPPQHATPKEVRGEDKTIETENSLATLPEHTQTDDAAEQLADGGLKKAIQIEVRRSFAEAAEKTDVTTINLMDDLRADLKGELRDELRDELRQDIRLEVMGELRLELKNDILEILQGADKLTTRGSRLSSYESSSSLNTLVEAADEEIPQILHETNVTLRKQSKNADLSVPQKIT